MKIQLSPQLLSLLSVLMKPQTTRGGHQIGPGRQTVLGLHRKIEDHGRRAAIRRAQGRWAQ